MENISPLPLFFQKLFGVVAAVLLIMAMLVYIKSLLKHEVTPRPLSWIGWFLLMGISIFSQIMEKGFQLGQVTTIISIFGCLVIFFLSLRNGVIEKNDKGCLFFGLGCAVVYLITRDAWITTGFGIVADTLIAIPTIRNALKNPNSEKSIAWILGCVGYVITIPNCFGLNIVYLLFPVYLLCFNGLMVYLTYARKQKSPSKI